MANFGELLSELRQDKGMKQRDLADIIHVTPGTISNYENGVNMPSVETAILIADYFNVTLDYLFGRVRHNIAPNYYERELYPGTVLGSIIKSMESLSDEDKRVLCYIIKRLDVYTSVITKKTIEE